MGQAVTVEHLDQSMGKLDVPTFITAKHPEQLPDYLQAVYLWHSQMRYQEAQACLYKGEIEWIGKVMKLYGRVHGDRPDNGYKIFIGLHGGGDGSKKANDEQWEKHKGLYKHQIPFGSIWIAPRAPEDMPNMWSQPYIDDMFERLFERLMTLNIADPKKIYISGYSDGADGVFRLGTRMTDWLAGIGISGGLPGDITLKNCRNIGCALHVGENDHDSHRVEANRKLMDQLKLLHEVDSDGGYANECVIHKGKGQWMDELDGNMFLWLADQTRNPFPNYFVWVQDSEVIKYRFYWIMVPPESAKGGSTLRAKKFGNTFQIHTTDYPEFTLYLSECMVDMKSPISVFVNGTLRFSDRVSESTDKPVEVCGQGTIRLQCRERF